MITKSTIKSVAALRQQKYRKEQQLFVVEGRKIVNELIESDFEITQLFATEKYCAENKIHSDKVEIATEVQMEQMSGQDTAPGILAVVRQPKTQAINSKATMVLAMDGISNPGNMGTIIRTAEWFGIRNIVCSKDCVEIWNPKVIQATMGSIFRMNIVETDLETYLTQSKNQGKAIFGALLNGENLFKRQGKAEGIVVIGSESHGIRPNILPLITHPVTIPRAEGSLTESLNASVAAAIIMAWMAGMD